MNRRGFVGWITGVLAVVFGTQHADAAPREARPLYGLWQEGTRWGMHSTGEVFVSHDYREVMAQAISYCYQKPTDAVRRIGPDGLPEGSEAYSVPILQGQGSHVMGRCYRCLTPGWGPAETFLCSPCCTFIARAGRPDPDPSRDFSDPV